jgi:hypothetical protein
MMRTSLRLASSGIIDLYHIRFMDYADVILAVETLVEMREESGG